MDNLQDKFSNSICTLHNIIYKIELFQDIIDNIKNNTIVLSNKGTYGLTAILQEMANNGKNALDEIESTWLALKKRNST